MKHFDAKDVPKARELGFEIEEINDHSHEFEVKVRFPDSNQTLRTFTFSRSAPDDWQREVEWVEDGEVHKMPRWKKHIKRRLKQQLDAIEQQSNSEELKKHEGKKLDI